MSQENGDSRSSVNERFFDNLLLSLNLGSGFLLAGLMLVLKSASSIPNFSDSAYLALRSVYRVSDFLRFQSINPVSTGTTRREFPPLTDQIASEIAVFITGLAAIAVVFFLLRLFDEVQLARKMKQLAELPVLLLSGPVLFVMISWWTWEAASWERVEPAGRFFSNSLPFLVLITEFPCLCVTLFRPGRWNLRKVITVLAIIHWTFWTFFPWRETVNLLFPMYARNLFLILLPVSTLLWVWREKSWARALGELLYTRRRYLYGLNVVAIAVGVSVWHPALNADLGHPQDWKNVEVEVSRGPCFGSCPVYTITVHGDGRIDYSGRKRHSQRETRKSGTLEKEKIARILQILTQAEFSTLDGRAFGWSFDTASIGIRASVDGRTKEVVCDTWDERSGAGRQAKFLKAAAEVDSILKSTSWAECEGECGEDQP